MLMLVLDHSSWGMWRTAMFSSVHLCFCSIWTNLAKTLNTLQFVQQGKPGLAPNLSQCKLCYISTLYVSDVMTPY